MINKVVNEVFNEPPAPLSTQHPSIEPWRSTPLDRGRGKGKPIPNATHRGFQRLRVDHNGLAVGGRLSVVTTIGGRYGEDYPSRVGTPEAPMHPRSAEALRMD
jgi:hypothetical protein